MTMSMLVAAPPPVSAQGSDYVPGVCNIGPAEIARRRRAGHVGALLTLGIFAVLVIVGVPPIVRLVVALPAAIAASGYLQAYLKFCAGFGSSGVFNFGALGSEQKVEDASAKKQDRARAMQIGLASAAIGVLVGVVAVVLPL
jgi:hypothetical protein